MKIGEILQQVHKEMAILENHMAEPVRDPDFIKEHAASLSDYALLLRDIAVSEEDLYLRRKRLSSQSH